VIKKSYEILNSTSQFLNYNLLLLYGENFGLKKDIKESIKQALEQKDNDIEFISLDENEIINNEERFFNSVYSDSLFSSKKIITINNGTDKIIDQIKYVTEKYPENVFLIIFSNILEKKSKLRNFFEKNNKVICVPCYLDNYRDLQIIAVTELKKNNIILSKESINLLIEQSNSDRNNLKNEIEKIKSFAVENKSVELSKLKSIINFSGEYKSDSLINECLNGNILQYKNILSELYSYTVNYVFMLRILSNKVQRLLSIKETKNKSENFDSLINAFKPPIFWQDKPNVKKQLTIWNINDLINIKNEINITELLCKKNPQISKMIFFKFFNKICKKANSFS